MQPVTGKGTAQLTEPHSRMPGRACQMARAPVLNTHRTPSWCVYGQRLEKLNTGLPLPLAVVCLGLIPGWLRTHCLAQSLSQSCLCLSPTEMSKTN